MNVSEFATNSVHLNITNPYRKWNTVPTVVKSVEFIANSIPLIFRVFDKINLLDNKYWLTDVKSYRKIAKEAISLDHNYVIDRFDCDDFSAVLYCYSRYEYEINGIGRVIDYVSRHSYNVAVDSSGNFWIIEPQTASIFKPSERNKKLYSLIFASITF